MAGKSQAANNETQIAEYAGRDISAVFRGIVGMCHLQSAYEQGQAAVDRRHGTEQQPKQDYKPKVSYALHRTSVLRPEAEMGPSQVYIRTNLEPLLSSRLVTPRPSDRVDSGAPGPVDASS